MSISLINQYYKRVEDLIRYSGKDNEGVISREFEWLINAYCEKRKLRLIPQFEFKSKLGTSIRPDGTIKSDLRIDYGYWESKAKVDLEDEIRKKFNAGYPNSNTLFEDSKTAVLYQDGQRVMQADLRNAQELDKILTAFTSYEHPEVKNFNKAVENFKKDIPKIVVALREMITKEENTNAKFKEKRAFFWELCKNSINPDILLAEVNEMLIQHILTEEIFISIFSEAQFHQENNIAKELYEVEKTFFVGNTKRELLNSVRNYYEMIKAQATVIINHTEKQTFLKSIYENFYKAYNPKGADRLGIVYTPSEIVKFQIESTDYLLEKHFGKTLSDKNVEILDPATGTGTYICDIIEYIPAQYLAEKYKNEIHANEVAILPYYIANLNIEYTFRNKMGYYAEFPNICFVDTLDNVGGLKYEGKQFDMFGFSVENADRIKRQNDKRISVIIGNPPYNAKQDNFNSQNANRPYKTIDTRIKETYIKHGISQNQIVVYDMYVRFFRWASDRLNENGVISFITNNSFIDGRAFDGFRKTIQQEFDYVYIVDLGGDIRKLSGKDGIWLNENNTIFGMAAAVGISLIFMIKKTQQAKLPCQIFYIHPCDIRATRQEKFEFLKTNTLRNINFERIVPDKKGNWINLSDNDFETLLPLIDKDVKAGKSQDAIFQLFSSGLKTQRDEWVYDFSKESLAQKMVFFTKVYEETRLNPLFEDKQLIKWDRELNTYLERGIEKEYERKCIVTSIYRPFTKKCFYFDKHFNGMTYQWFNIYKPHSNKIICIPGLSSPKDFHCLGLDTMIDLNALPAGGQCLPLYRYDTEGNQIENITDWTLQQFTDYYTDQSITKESIFYYVYAILHNPIYRQKYEQNLKRDFPRIPFYEDFWQWAKWGKELMDLHIGYEQVEPFALTRKEIQPKQPKTKAPNLLTDIEAPKALFEDEAAYTFIPKAKLKAHKDEGTIEIDELTTLSGIPSEAWEYKLGNRTALEWILDQYKESKPSDPTVAEKFNTYKFADYKEQVIDLLLRVCTVSVETVRIVKEMQGE